MWDCGSPPESAGRTSHEPTVQNKNWKFDKNSHSFVDITVRPAHLRQGGTLDAAGEFIPCCRPGAGQCSCSHPTVSGQPWPGEGGWLDDTKAFISSKHRHHGPILYVTRPTAQGWHSPTVPLCPLSAATIRAERPLLSTVFISAPWRSTS